MTYQVPVKEHESDRLMREAREASQAATLTPGEEAELYRNLTPAEQAALAKSAGVTIGNKHSLRVSFRNGEAIAEEFTAHRHNPSTQSGDVPAGLERARSPLGQAVNSWKDVKAETVLYIGGVQAQAGMAAKAGLICQLPDGSFGPASAPSPEALAAEAAAKAAAASTETPDLVFPETFRDTVAELDAHLGGERQTDSMIRTAILSGVDDPSAVSGLLVKKLGIEPEHAADVAAGMIAEGTASTAAWITAHEGCDGAEAIKWASENIPASERARLITRIFNGDKEAMRTIAQGFKKALRAAAHPVR